MSGIPTPLTIGPVTIDMPVFLAPMSGITDAPFRRLALQHGAPAVVCEMIASGELARLKPDTLRRASDPGGGPLIVQLAGREPRPMAQAARIAADLGADIIDINMGCPAKKVTGGLSGAALMREPDRAFSLIEAVMGAVALPVTVKMRLGWDAENRNAAEIAAGAEARGVGMVTVHGRTRCQFYDGRADWASIAEVKARVGIPVIANGDIADFDDALEVLRVTGADGVMIGRGALGRPWFAGEVAHLMKSGTRPEPIPLGVEADAIASQVEDMLEHYGCELGLRCARKHLGWTLARHLGGEAAERAWRARLCTGEDMAGVRSALSDFYAMLGNRMAA